MSTAQQFCTFYVGSLFLGIEVQTVQEVIRYQRMTRVPLAPNSIRGLINLRGQIVTAVDLRTWLNLPPLPAGEFPMNVVVRDGEEAISFLVDRIGEVVEVSEDQFEAPPATVNPHLRNFVLGTYKLPGQLLLVLNTRLAIQATGNDTALKTA